MPKILIFEDENMIAGMYAIKYSLASFEVAYFGDQEKGSISIVRKYDR